MGIRHSPGHRRLFHLLFGFTLIGVLFLTRIFPKQNVLFFLLFVLLLFFQIEFFRLELQRPIPFLHALWREQEQKKVGSEIFFLIGGIFVIAFFDFSIALTALLMTTFGDLVSSIVGEHFHYFHIKHSFKSWEAACAEFLVDLVLGLLFLPGIIAFVMAFTATAVEILSTQLDDNLLVPLFAGFNGQIILWLLIYFKFL